MLPYIEISGKLLPMYGLCIATGILFAALFMLYDCKGKSVRWENSVLIGLIGVFFGFLGAKILYILVTYDFSEITDMVRNFNFNDLSEGGFVFYGGLITGVFGAFVSAKILREKLFDYESVLVKIIPLVHAFGRLGCFCAGCCYGKPTDSRFSVIYENPISDAPIGEPLMPVQLYEAGFNFILFIALWIIDRKCKKKLVLPIYILAYGIERFIIEFMRYDVERGIYFGLSTSQWISIVMCIAGTALLIFRLQQKVDKNVQSRIHE